MRSLSPVRGRSPAVADNTLAMVQSAIHKRGLQVQVKDPDRSKVVFVMLNTLFSFCIILFLQKMKAVADAAKDAANESKKQLEFSEDERRKLEKNLNAVREELDAT